MKQITTVILTAIALSACGAGTNIPESPATGTVMPPPVIGCTGCK